jgi:hypothetical protein
MSVSGMNQLGLNNLVTRHPGTSRCANDVVEAKERAS